MEATSSAQLPFLEVSALFERLRLDGPCSQLIRSTRGDHHLNGMLDGTHRSSDITIRPSFEAPATVLADYQTKVLPVVQALFPRSVIGDGQCSTVEDLSAMQMKLLVYAVTNRLAGVSAGFPLNVIYDYLKEPMARLLSGNSLALLGVENLRSTPAVAETYFVCAVEAGDVNTVHRLLSSGIRGIDVNNTVCAINGAKYTPIERSARLQQLEMTKVLLRAGADVNKSHQHVKEDHWTVHVKDPSPFAPPCGALEHAWKAYDNSSSHSYQLVTVLAQAGGEGGSQMLSELLEREDVPVVEIMVHHGVRKFYETWIKNGFLQRCVGVLSKASLGFVATELDGMGLDFSQPLVSSTYGETQYGFWEDGHPLLFMIDVAAHRGDLDLVMYLRGCGAQMTSDVLTAAVQSRNVELVRYLIDEGAPLDNFSFQFHSTPLAEAIRLQDQHLIHILGDVVDMEDIEDRNCFCAILAAIAETGAINMLELCMDMRHHCSEAVLGYALTKAILAYQEDSATMLLNAGASLDGQCIAEVFGGKKLPYAAYHEHHEYLECMKKVSPLVAAIATGQHIMMNKLLDHGAECSGAVQAAVQRGDLAVLDDVLSVSVPTLYEFNNVSGLAFKEASEADDACQFLRLLSAGYLPSWLTLTDAVRQNNLTIVQNLLEWGVVCLSPGILGDAIKKSSDMFLLILRVMTSRLPRGLGMFGAEALDCAIKSGRLDLVEILIEHGASCSPYRRYFGLDFIRSAFATAIRMHQGQDLQLVYTLMKSGVNLNEIISDCGKSNELLFDARHGETPLLLAISTEQEDLVQLFIDRGSQINLPATRKIKRTPLQLAAENGSYRIVKLLLDRGADVNGRPAARSGATALQFAAFAGNIGIVELLLDHGADAIASGAIVHGRTAIEGAAECGRFDMVVFLLKRCSPPLHQIAKAKEKAQSNNHQAIVDLLKDAEAEAIIRSSSTELHLVQGYHPAETQPATAEELFESDTEDLELEQGLRPTCSMCSNDFVNVSALRRHERTKHQDRVAPKTWPCGECSKTFTRKDTLGRHSATHNRSRYAECASCGNSFRPDYLSQHTTNCRS